MSKIFFIFLNFFLCNWFSSSHKDYQWIPTSAYAGIPPNTVYAGNDADGAPIYVGRCFHEGEQLPAKVIPSKQVAYVSHNGLEIAKQHYEVT